MHDNLRFEKRNREEIAKIICSYANSGETINAKLNPHTVSESYDTLKILLKRKGLLSSKKRIVLNGILTQKHIFASFASRIGLFFQDKEGVTVWYGNGSTIKDESVLMSFGKISDDPLMELVNLPLIVLINITPIFEEISPFLD